MKEESKRPESASWSSIGFGLKVTPTPDLVACNGSIPARLACTKNLKGWRTYMDPPSASMRDLALRLLAANQVASGSQVDEAMVLIEKLRTMLTKFAGPEGFKSLLRRALTLAKAEVPSLQNVKIGADGRLEGFEEIVADKAAGGAGDQAAVAITAHLLGLLITFIGEPLTLRLERMAWTDESRLNS